jgi:5'-nucleotidase
VSRAKGAEAVRKALAAPWDPDLFYSINFPAGAPEAVKGWKVAAQGRRKGAPFSCTEHRSASGRLYYWLGHATDNASAGPGSDAVLTADGWITVTPLRPHLTAHDVMDGARAAVE